MRELERNRTNETDLPTLAVIGAGRVGRSIARAAAAAGHDVELVGRSGIAAAAAGRDAALLCVPDSEISVAARALAAADPAPRFAGHTSGATPLSALAATSADSEAFSLHPLQTIPDGRALLEGAPCAIAGSSMAAERFAATLASGLGMRPFTIPEEARGAYHAAASIASNFMITLEEAAAELLEACGVEDGRELLAPLVLRTASNWADRGAAALTGPIARGDEETVERHLSALTERAPELVELYRALAERTGRLGSRAATEVGA